MLWSHVFIVSLLEPSLYNFPGLLLRTPRITVTIVIIIDSNFEYAIIQQTLQRYRGFVSNNSILYFQKKRETCLVTK